MHGDVNAAYRIRSHEWIQLAKGDPQWPQAFYPTNSMFDLKDGDALVGRCTYHNDENRAIHAGPTHNDEMCNIYLMYYTDDISNVLDVCTGNLYPQLESIIPAESERKPSPLASFTKNNGDNNSNNNILSHHDMEGSKMHHELDDSKGANKNKDSSFPKTLSYYLNQLESNTDDYYDDIERSRSKLRNNNNNNNNNIKQTDSLSPAANEDAAPFYDANALGDALNGDSDDYLSFGDQAQSLLLAAAFDKLNVNNNNNNNKNSKLKNNVKNQLNNLLPKTVLSK